MRIARGLSFRQKAHRIGKKHSFVQAKSDFLRSHAMMIFGRWNVDVQALGMIKTAEFYDYEEGIKSEILGDKYENFYLSYLTRIMMGKMKYYIH